MSNRTDETDANADMPGSGRPALVKALLHVTLPGAIFFLIFCVVFPIGIVRGSSMQPTLDGGTFIIGARWAKPDYQDIVSIDSSALGEQIIKRVIGLPGDQVLCGGSVWLNRQALEEPYVAYSGGLDTGELTVPEGTLFVLGDNRAVSLDSRYSDLGMVPEDEVMSVVLFYFRIPFLSDLLKNLGLG